MSKGKRKPRCFCGLTKIDDRCPEGCNDEKLRRPGARRIHTGAAAHANDVHAQGEAWIGLPLKRVRLAVNAAVPPERVTSQSFNRRRFC